MVADTSPGQFKLEQRESVLLLILIGPERGLWRRAALR